MDTAPLQRLRHIHQLALTFLVYPGATHRRFEHSLGVMELAGRVFDVVTHRDALTDEIRESVPEVADDNKCKYWKRVLRMAALCHDIGHLPFSHAAEATLLPAGWDHERITRALIESPEMAAIWKDVTPPLRPCDVVKLAVGPRKASDLTFTVWETILSEIITGDSFGVDRIDYLLRDSHHAGVAYGRFDHFRLIDELRILPPAPAGGSDPSSEPALGVEEGGLQSAEALLLARYFMYSQVYFHPVRRIYDIHLKDFLKAWLTGGEFPTAPGNHLRTTDNEVMAAMLNAARDSSAAGHDHACRIVQHEHFRVLYKRHPDDVKKNPEAAKAIFQAATEKFGEDNVRQDRYRGKGGITDFPVRLKDGRTASSLSVSEVLNKVPVAAFDYVFIAPGLEDEAKGWLKENREKIIQPAREEES
ncbi:MAG: HD domain-containing protein [Planctomycetota bacterium]